MYLQRLYTENLSMAASTERYRSPKRPKANKNTTYCSDDGSGLENWLEGVEHIGYDYIIKRP